MDILIYIMVTGSLIMNLWAFAKLLIQISDIKNLLASRDARIPQGKNKE